MSTRSNSSNLFSLLRDPESLIRRRNLGEPSSLFDFEEVMRIPHYNIGPPPTGPPPPNNNGPPPMDTSATRDETSRNISSTTTTESPKVVRQLEMTNKFFVEMMRQIQMVKIVDTKCETCGGPHSFTECPAVGGYTQEAAYATTGSGSLPSNTIANPRGDVKALPPEVVLLMMDLRFYLLLLLSQRKWNVKPRRQSAKYKFRKYRTRPTSVGKFYFLADLVVVDYDVDPRVPLILGRPFLRTTRALIDVYGEELTLRIDYEAITFKVGQTLRDSCIHQVAIPLLRILSSLLIPPRSLLLKEEISFLEEIETFLHTPEELYNLDDDYYDTEGEIIYLKKLLNEDPSLTLPPIKNDDLKQVDVTLTKPSIEEPPEL
ncbi:reverse transcriptase domain-containing protein [Tanacetum coccineum]